MMNNFNNFGFPVEKNNIYTNQVGNTNQSIFGNSGYMVPTKPMDYDGYFGSQTKKPSFWDKTKMFFSQYGSKIFGWGITIFGGLGAFALGKKFIDLDVPYGKGQPKPADDDSFLRKFKYNVCTFLSDTVGIMNEYKGPTKDADSVAPAAAEPAGAPTSTPAAEAAPAAPAEPGATPAAPAEPGATPGAEAAAPSGAAESKPVPAAPSTTPAPGSSPIPTPIPVSNPGIPAETEGEIDTRKKPEFDTISFDDEHINKKKAWFGISYEHRNAIANFDGSSEISKDQIENLTKNEFKDVNKCSRTYILKYLHTKLGDCINDEDKLSNLIKSITATATTATTSGEGLATPTNNDINTALDFLNEIINANKNLNNKVVSSLVISLSTLSNQTGINDTIRDKISYLMRCVILKQIDDNSATDVKDNINKLFGIVYDGSSLKITDADTLQSVITDLATIGEKTENIDSQKTAINALYGIGKETNNKEVTRKAISAINDITLQQIDKKKDIDVQNNVNALFRIVHDTDNADILGQAIKALVAIGIKENINDESKEAAIKALKNIMKEAKEENVKTQAAAAVITLADATKIDQDTINALTVSDKTADSFTLELVKKLKDAHDKADTNEGLKKAIIDKLQGIAESTDIKDDVKNQANEAANFFATDAAVDEVLADLTDAEELQEAPSIPPLPSRSAPIPIPVAPAPPPPIPASIPPIPVPEASPEAPSAAPPVAPAPPAGADKMHISDEEFDAIADEEFQEAPPISPLPSRSAPPPPIPPSIQPLPSRSVPPPVAPSTTPGAGTVPVVMNSSAEESDAIVADLAARDYKTAKGYATDAANALTTVQTARGIAANAATAEARAAADNAIVVLENAKAYFSCKTRSKAAAKAHLYIVYNAAYTVQACVFAAQATANADYLKKALNALGDVNRFTENLRRNYSTYKTQIEHADDALNAAQNDFNTALTQAGITLERLNSLNL